MAIQFAYLKQFENGQGVISKSGKRSKKYKKPRNADIATQFDNFKIGLKSILVNKWEMIELEDQENVVKFKYFFLILEFEICKLDILSIRHLIPLSINRFNMLLFFMLTSGLPIVILNLSVVHFKMTFALRHLSS